MNKILLPLNVLLVAAVGYLFYKQSAGNNSTGKTTRNDSTASVSNVKIAYFEIDSLVEGLKYFKDAESEIKIRRENASRELEGMRKNYQGRMNQLQQKAQAGQMTQADQEAAQAEAATMQKNLVEKEKALSNNINNENVEKTQQLHTMIENYLKKYNKDKGFNFIIASSKGLFYYKDSALNITNSIIAALNAEYIKK
jgi:outer membrane protein